MAKVKSSDPFPRLVHECVRDIGLSILLGIGLMLASVVNAKSINPVMHFQQDPQHVEYNGLAHVILKEAYRRIGHPVAGKQVRKKQADGILIAPENAQLNENYIRIPIAIVKLKVFAYIDKSHGNTEYEFGLLGNRISIVDGMPMVQNAMAGFVIEKMRNVNSSLTSVLRNQADVVLLPEFCAIGRSKKHLLAQMTALQPAVYEVPMYHYIRREHQHLVRGLEHSLKAMERKQLISQVTHSYKVVLEADAEA